MSNYQFTYNEKTYELGEDNCSYLMDDEDNPVAGIEIPDILELLNQAEEVNFDLKYYGQPCQNCRAGKEEKAKFFKFLEYHFYIFTKNGEYVMSSISKEFTNTSFTRLLKEGKTDNSFIVSVMVCINCGEYSVEIEQCDV
ncbi:MAG: hypothetical protein JM58_05865 [Peptococcaceae bacterium BICA1-8]|nr:MAG: hypothetical protein JM58_05865 [Peptococcaceae bacterium BICA1-8]